MIKDFWTATTILLPLAGACIAGSWKLISLADEDHRKYTTDLEALRATLQTKELFPVFISNLFIS